MAAIYIRVNVTGVMAARCAGKMRNEPDMAGFAAIVAEPKSSDANANTDGSSRSRGGSAPWIESCGVAAGQALAGAEADPFVPATWVGQSGRSGAHWPLRTRGRDHDLTTGKGKSFRAADLAQ